MEIRRGDNVYLHKGTREEVRDGMLYMLVTDIQSENKYSCEFTVKMKDTGVALRYNTEEFIVPSMFSFFNTLIYVIRYFGENNRN